MARPLALRLSLMLTALFVFASLLLSNAHAGTASQGCGADRPLGCASGIYTVADGDVAGLIAAINAANASAGPDTIELANGGTYILTAVNNTDVGPTGLPPISDTLTISGNGATVRRRADEGTPDFRILAVAQPGELVLRGLTVANGRLVDGVLAQGGGIYNAGVLRLIGSSVVDSQAISLQQRPYTTDDGAMGGGIYSGAGGLALVDSRVSGNRAVVEGVDPEVAYGSDAFGGGIALASNATSTWVSIERSIISDNYAQGGDSGPGKGGWAYGGGIDARTAGTVTISATAIVSNTAKGSAGGARGSGVGGGISMSGGMLSVDNTTVSNNLADGTGGYGGGIYSTTASRISRSTISYNVVKAPAWGGNQGGGFLQDSSQPLTQFRMVLLAHNVATSGPNCYSRWGSGIVSLGYNLVPDSISCPISATTGDLFGSTGAPVDPRLGPLQDNGGATLTRALGDGSPALDAGDPAGCTLATGAPATTDQRGPGFPRVLDGNGGEQPACDIGAYEAPGAAVETPTPTITPTPTPSPTPSHAAPTGTATATVTPTATHTASATATMTPTPTHTASATATSAASPTPSPTPSRTATPARPPRQYLPYLSSARPARVLPPALTLPAKRGIVRAAKTGP